MVSVLLYSNEPTTASDYWVFFFEIQKEIIPRDPHVQVKLHICIYGSCCKTAELRDLQTPGGHSFTGSDLGDCERLEYNPLDLSKENTEDGEVTLKVEHSGSQAWPARYISIYFPNSIIYNQDMQKYNNNLYPRWVKTDMYLHMP